ncbi:hypothetical protein QIS74_12230 [Colletotrichum tabaci]|uniref:Uncharacterized protein n=1 Tax=Colletotrichum tabaci TaxID=1209068 RepID=A0AAV9SWB1_9PEZI
MSTIDCSNRRGFASSSSNDGSWIEHETPSEANSTDSIGADNSASLVSRSSTRGTQPFSSSSSSAAASRGSIALVYLVSTSTTAVSAAAASSRSSTIPVYHVFTSSTTPSTAAAPGNGP